MENDQSEIESINVQSEIHTHQQKGTSISKGGSILQDLLYDIFYLLLYSMIIICSCSHVMNNSRGKKGLPGFF